MHLKGSCHCGAVQFELASPHPVPFNRCYCSICRKTAGAGGYAINIGGKADTLSVTGEENLSTYQARTRDPNTGNETVSPMQRKFCSKCGSHLWGWDPRWPELVHPHASAIDTDLPQPPETVHLMLGSKSAWVEPAVGPSDKCFDEYPEESLEAWHTRHGLEC